MNTFNKRLKHLVDKLAGGKHTVFAKKCGIPPGTFQAYIDSETIPKGEQLLKIGSVYRINLNWLLMGEGEPFIQKGGETDKIKGATVGEELLREVIMAVEEWLNRRGVTLVPAKKADLVLTLYHHFREEGVQVDKDTVGRFFLKLVA